MWAHLIEAWASLYANSGAIRTVLGFSHVAGLLIGGGAAITADRGVLAAVRRRAFDLSAHVATIRRTHSIVLASLTVVMVSGLLLAASDIETFLHAPLFWLKMGLVALLTVNGVGMRFAERRAMAPHSQWKPLAMTSAMSLALWLLTTLAGAALPNVH